MFYFILVVLNHCSLIISAKEVMFLPQFVCWYVCLSVCLSAGLNQNVVNEFLMKFLKVVDTETTKIMLGRRAIRL